MKKYKEKKIILDKCICRFFNSKGKQIYIKDYSTYLFSRKRDYIDISFFLDNGEIQKIAKNGLKSIKVEFSYREIIFDIKNINKKLYKFLKFFRLPVKRCKTISNKMNKCTFQTGYGYTPKNKKESFSTSINFVYDFNDINYKDALRDPLTKQFNLTKLPNILTKKVYE
jgi:hypothetical protein